ncbi:methionine sulfoxide reductase [Pseudomonas agarici]|uniref:peptide-methionine (R)-S-oxide reductase n=1 Tax=Pseudomonas agarici TaxID=46677 RepID=A0A0X1SYZ4_PSEAA|nr:peptide-methionine (R)-S-oxide reductase MsrB [Pseudomonas agarici]AMB85044.1 methionine sulfoxide reductase [Pseudomonas agarici]NWB91353.1 peptide-methionine (R)-S-oxide reductase MsrB [Pseudomonas agarici]NWC08337.1 peptide-methionine (R)-S-oxide reductase MsrB [Pseudomonas agarici]SEK64189.1 peptide-methionine (R)-S-oxide reductase [Pseudomonas agarici]
MSSRRGFLFSSAGALLAAGFVDWRATAATLSGQPAQAVPDETFEVTHSDDEWRTLLNDKQYQVLRNESTERPYSSALNDEHRDGVFACAGCQLALFTSAAKFDSRTGWPSFTAPLENAVSTRRDTSLGGSRIEVHCQRCGGHLGHVFPDGPRPTGLRYCMNGVAITFAPEAA